ncbi:MAG: DoxX family membrane protein [Armatimonadetes bacterium]|nr:DoxX family membrane protein [Armatimonadota bacterium]
MRRLHALVSHPATGALCRVFVGGIFIYTAGPKLLRADEFARLVNGYRLLHPDVVNLAGITLPWIELVAGTFLVIGLLPRSSALVIAGLLALFMGAGFLGLVRGLDIDCGCFFPFMLEHKLGWDLLLRDAILLLFPLQVLVWPSSFFRSRST